MSDHNIIYNEEFGFSTFERCIREELGEEFWLRLTDGLTLPVMETEPGCQCRNMYQFMERFRTMTDEKQGISHYPVYATAFTPHKAHGQGMYFLKQETWISFFRSIMRMK